MAATAAAIAMDVLGHGLAVPAARAGTRIRDGADRRSAQAEEAFDRWRETLPASIGRLRQALYDDEDCRAETLAFLDTVIAAVSAKIDAESVLAGSDEEGEAPAGTIAIERAWRDERVRFYYELLALRAEYDPDARGGPVFDTADGLEAFLATIESE